MLNYSDNGSLEIQMLCYTFTIQAKETLKKLPEKLAAEKVTDCKKRTLIIVQIAVVACTDYFTPSPFAVFFPILKKKKIRITFQVTILQGYILCKILWWRGGRGWENGRIWSLGKKI